MRLIRTAFRGLTRFTGADPVSVDWDALGPGVVAVVGSNGSGKTTTLESVPVALYRSFLSRPDFYQNFSGTDAFIEQVFEDRGQELSVRLAINAERRTAEAYFLIDGAPVASGKLTDFDGAVIPRFGSLSLFMASVFNAQNRNGNFLGLRKGDRKSLFLELLNLGHLEALAQEARGHAGATDDELRAARQRIAEVGQEVAQLGEVEAQLSAAQTAAEGAAGKLDTARQEEVAALGALARVRTAAERLGALTAAEASARSALLEAQRALEAAQREPGRIEARLAERLAAIEARKAHELRPAAERRARERREAVAARKVEDLEPAARNRHAAVVDGIERERGSIEKALAEVPDAREARERLGQIEADRKEVEAAGEEVRRLEASQLKADSALRAEQNALGVAKAARDAEIARLDRQAGLLDAVPCRTLPDISGGCQLLADAREAGAKLEALRTTPIRELHDSNIAVIAQAAEAALSKAQAAEPERLARLEELKREEHEARNDLAKAQAAAALRAQLARLDDRQLQADQRLAGDIEQARLAEEAAAAELARIAEDLAAALDEADIAVAAAADDAAIARDQAGAERVEAVAKIAAATEKADAAKAAHGSAEAALREARAELDGLDLAEAERNVAVAQADREAAERAIREADQAVAGLRARVEQLQAKAATLDNLRVILDAIEKRLGDWRHLERACGKDGVQALEIDAAGPEVARLTNELLTACYGPRFSLTFETTRAKRDGGQMEVFDVRVFDGAAERPVEALSGGERVIIGEAVGLAFSIFNSRKSGVRWQSFWRDETAGALDEENATRYVAMLRRALELAGAFQIIFVAHQSEVYEAADAIVYVEGGKVSTGRAAA